MRYAKCDANPVRFVSAASDHHLLVLRVLDNLLLARNLLIKEQYRTIRGAAVPYLHFAQPQLPAHSQNPLNGDPGAGSFYGCSQVLR